MLYFWAAFICCTLPLGMALSIHNDPGEYGSYNLWRKTLCEKNSELLNADLENCLELEPSPVVKAFEDCFGEAAPEINGKITAYILAACEDKTIFHKVDSCFEEYEANEVFKQQMVLREEALECYLTLIKKHNLPELMVYFNGTEKS